MNGVNVENQMSVCVYVTVYLHAMDWSVRLVLALYAYRSKTVN